ncbi:MAG: hypothetical protein RIC95_00945 [Vicingaceae bacterium]
MQKLILIIIVVSLHNSLFAQKRDRYRFAETYFGLEAEFNPQDNTFQSFENGELNSGSTPSTLSPRVLIGGTHFWGHADFYVSLPLTNFRLNGSKKVFHTNGVLTGFRFLPFKLEGNSLKPFVGVGFNSKTLRIDEGPLYTNWQWYYEGGLNYRNANNRIFGLELRYFPKASYQTYIDRSQSVATNLDQLTLSFSYKKAIDYSRNSGTEKYQRFYKRMKKDLRERKKLNTYSIGLGANALIPLAKTEHASRKAFFNDEIEGKVTVDLGLAYFIHNWNAAARLSYRPLRQAEEAHDYRYRLDRHSLALETFKFIGNYHGFVPFIGPYVSADYFRLKEKDQGKVVTDIHRREIGYGIVFGWDIRFSETDPLILRTNLRYNPDYNFTQDGLSFTAKNIEFNFIQVVIYPERFKSMKKLN